MAHSRKDKALTRERIVRVAARRFREVGLNGIGISDLMKEAGRTAGGFYKHFETRDQLVGEALTHAFAARDNIEMSPPGAKPDLGDLVNRYLSEDHRDEPGAGCAIAALVNDVERAGLPVRTLYTAQVQKEIELLQTSIGKKPTVKTRQQAILALCTMVGAITLSRAVIDEELSAAFLEVRKTLLKLTPP